MKYNRTTLLASFALAALLALPFPLLAAAEEAADDQLEPLSSAYTLTYDEDAVAGVGTQESTGHTSCCLAFCEAYGDSMFYGETIDHTEYAYYGDCASNPCATWDGWRGTEYDATYAVFEIMESRPCIMHVNNKNWGSEHWVLVIGYYDVDDPWDATIGNLIVLDPWDGEIIPATERYVRHSDYEIRLSSRGMTVPQKPREFFGTHYYEQGFCVECGAMWGDLNGNGLVNVVDAQIAYDVANGTYGSYGSNAALWALADVTGPYGHPDGTTDAQDALAIQFFALTNA